MHIHLDTLAVATKQHTGSSHQGNEDSELEALDPAWKSEASGTAVKDEPRHLALAPGGVGLGVMAEKEATGGEVCGMDAGARSCIWDALS